MAKIQDNVIQDVEDLRCLLETYHSTPVMTFAPNQQQYVYDALDFLLGHIPNSDRGSATFKKESICQLCLNSKEETTDGIVTCLPPQATVEAMLSQQSDGILIPSDTKKTCCQEPGSKVKEIPVKEFLKVSKAKDYLTILASRDPAHPQQMETYPTEMLVIDGKRYQIRSVITHHGISHNSGHYTTAVFNQNRWFMVDDFNPLREFKHPDPWPKTGLLYVYEKLEDTDPDPLVVKNIEFLPPLVRESRKGQAANAKVANIVNKETIQSNIRRMGEIHLNGMNMVNQNQSNKVNLTPHNPALVHGLKMFEKLEDYNRSKPCIICQESWFNFSINEQNGMCSRCERLAKDGKYTFGKGNSMVPSEIPDCIVGLTYIEQCTIKKANPFFNVYCRKGGKTGMVGHTITYERDLQGLATILPRYSN